MRRDFARLAALGDATRADHLDVIVHQGARTARVAKLDQVGKLGVNFQDVPCQFRRGGDVAAWPRDVLERDELHQNDAIVRGLGHGEMEIARQPREFVEIADRRFGFTQQPAQFFDILRRGVFGGEFGAKRLNGALRIHDFGRAHAGEVELHGERFGEQARIAVRDARAAAFAHADFDNTERFQRA